MGHVVDFQKMGRSILSLVSDRYGSTAPWKNRGNDDWVVFTENWQRSQPANMEDVKIEVFKIGRDKSKY